ncbi:MAG: hypothetical protein Q9M14_00910 [Mariprofundaceae bacterium]|nr:hypothetical protein [Mariprofundaceae bacterium]
MSAEHFNRASRALILRAKYQLLMLEIFKCIRNCVKGKQRMVDTPKMIANRCHISANDCESAKKYLEAYFELKSQEKTSENSFFIHCEGLLIAAIIAYCRAFTFSKSSGFAVGKVKVDLGKAFNYDTLKIEQHKRLIAKRNKAIAHADWAYHKTELVEVMNGSVLRKRPCINFGEDIDKNLFIQMTKIMTLYFSCKQYDLDAEIK